MSDSCNARNDGTPFANAGAAKTVFLVCDLSVAVNVPDDVIGVPETVNIFGIDKPTNVTDPAPVAGLFVMLSQ